MLHRGIEPASAACRSDALSTELNPHPTSYIFLCSPLPPGICLTLGLSIPSCCLPTSFSVFLSHGMVSKNGSWLSCFCSTMYRKGKKCPSSILIEFATDSIHKIGAMVVCINSESVPHNVYGHMWVCPKSTPQRRHCAKLTPARSTAGVLSNSGSETLLKLKVISAGLNRHGLCL